MSTNGSTDRKRKRRWGDASSNDPPPVPPAAGLPPPRSNGAPAGDAKAKMLALQASVKAKLAALKARSGGATTAASGTSGVTSLKRPPPALEPTPSQPAEKRAKHYELDMAVTGPTYNQIAAPAKPTKNPYLSHKEEEEEAVNTNDDSGDKVGPFDERLERSDRARQRHKALKFVEPGTFVEIAERRRLKAANAEKSGFSSGRKAGMYVQSSNMANIYGTTEILDNDDDFLSPRLNDKITTPHVLEWWDLELLPSKLKKQVAAYEGKVLAKETQSKMQQVGGSASSSDHDWQNSEVSGLQTRCFEQAALSYSKTAALVQHIVPIQPPHAKDKPNVEPTLYLTKKELKRQRKLRRQEKQRELQDLQAAGLVPPPEPRLTLRNFIRVLGDQAYVDPSQMEQKVLEQVEARQRAHLERNERNKLTKEQRAAKLARKLKEDTTGSVHVALFYVKDMSHPYHRTKVDLNAQQFNITGGVLECEQPQLSCVICEGGPKSIKKYIRLMTVRMKWKGPENAEEEEDEDDDDEEEGVKRQKFNQDNKCELVWTGMATKRFFKGFVFQACETSDQASKILRAKGVGHYWDQVLTHASGRGDAFALRLAESSDDDEAGSTAVPDNVHPSNSEGGKEDVEMQED